MNKSFLSVRGFTLVEMLIVISIIGLLAGVVITSVSDARQNSRDKARVTGLAQIQLGLKLYQTQNGYYPRESDGFSGGGTVGRICESCVGPINDAIRQYVGSLPIDPLDTDDFYYYYDGSQSCGGNVNQVVISAVAMETTAYKNTSDTICSSWGGEGGIGDADSYNIVLGPSS